MSSRIEQIIEEIEEYIDRDCKFQPLSTTKIIVNKEHLDELLRELRMKTPDEIKRYQKIISNQDAILSDAHSKADAMLAEATAQTNELVNEHEIMQRAYAQANEIIEQAQAQAQAIIAQGRRMARQRLEGAPLEEEPMKRYAHPIPYCIDCPTPPPADGLDRILEALACQNQLLVELLGAGEVVDGVIDILNYVPQPRVLKLEPEKINALLGTDVDRKSVV